MINQKYKFRFRLTIYKLKFTIKTIYNRSIAAKVFKNMPGLSFGNLITERIYVTQCIIMSNI